MCFSWLRRTVTKTNWRIKDEAQNLNHAYLFVLHITIPAYTEQLLRESPSYHIISGEISRRAASSWHPPRRWPPPAPWPRACPPPPPPARSPPSPSAPGHHASFQVLKPLLKWHAERCGASLRLGRRRHLLLLLPSAALHGSPLHWVVEVICLLLPVAWEERRRQMKFAVDSDWNM